MNVLIFVILFVYTFVFVSFIRIDLTVITTHFLSVIITLFAITYILITVFYVLILMLTIVFLSNLYLIM